ncbi:MAG TPA: polyribonucleotide nucleotidyltransferase, partial [Myxococcota bacterium]|nr:polyribonucleotide nucleotidyltransferase [Myxococcota bacterium]
MNPITKTLTLGGRELTLETGRVARQADGSCWIRFGETVVLVATTAAASAREGVDFLPLTVDYRERSSAAGKIPGGFFKREGRPTEHEILSCRIIDRSIRPLFPKDWRFEIQVMATILSADPLNAPDVLAATAASLSLCLSDVPFAGPLATVRVGRVGGQMVINPTFKQLEETELELVVSCSKEAIVMVEGEAKEIPEEVMVEALLFAFDQCQPIIRVQEEIVAACGKPKRTYQGHGVDKALAEKVRGWVGDEMERSLNITEKLPRYHAGDALRERVLKLAKEAFPDLKTLGMDVEEVLDKMRRDIVRGRIARQGKRLDGRGLKDVRKITIELGVLPRAHGSALFTRGETQALVTITLGTSRDEQLIESLEVEYRKRFMLHYNFPPFSVGEVRPIRGPGRREIGHGALAERALKNLIPDA